MRNADYETVRDKLAEAREEMRDLQLALLYAIVQADYYCTNQTGRRVDSPQMDACRDLLAPKMRP